MGHRDADPQIAPVPAAASDQAAAGRPATDQAATDHAAAGEREGDQAASDRVADLEDRLRRALADADNMRKRCQRLATEARMDERARVAAAWLPIVDDLERALQHEDALSTGVVEGVRAVRDQAVALLAALGFPRHDETHVPFDPQRHEAVSVVTDEAEAPAGTVLLVLRPGYGEGIRQLRPATVVVAGGPE